MNFFTLSTFDSMTLQLQKAKNVSEVTWFWQPFHQIGIDALNFAKAYNLNTQEFEEIISDLSCTVAPTELKEELVLLDGLDSDGRIKSLNPEYYIRQSMKLWPDTLEKMFENQIYLPKISDLRKKLSFDKTLIPLLYETSEYRIATNFLTSQPLLLQKFHTLQAWDQLELMESLLGTIFSTSLLKFGHLDV
jgi:hypothetical protein